MFLSRWFILAVFCVGPVVLAQEKQALPYALYPIIQKDGVQAAVAAYKDWKQNRPNDFDFNEQALINLAAYLEGEGRTGDMLVLMKLNREVYPHSPIALYGLAEGHYAHGDQDQALKLFQQLKAELKTAEISDATKQFLENRADRKMDLAKNFVPAKQAKLTYTALYGGDPAGRWDMDNILKFQAQNGKPPIHYRPFDLYSSPIPQKTADAFNDQTPADVASGFIMGDYTRHIDQNRLHDLTPLWREQGWEDLFPESLINMASRNGKIWFVPQAFQANPIWYRKDIFQKLGLQPPKTWDAFLTLCRKINEAGYLPITCGMADWPPPVARWFTILNLRLNGPRFHQQTMAGEIPFTDKRIREVFTYWAQIFENKGMRTASAANTYRTAMSELSDGKAVMYNLGEWLFENYPKDQAHNLDFFTLPVIRPEVERAEIVHAYGAFLPVAARSPERGKAFLKWLADKDSQESNVKTLGRIVARKDIDLTLYSPVQKRLFQTVSQTPNLAPLLEFNARPELAQACLKAFVTFWRNPENADAVLAELEASRKALF